MKKSKGSAGPLARHIPLTGARAEAAIDLLRAGMPAVDSILSTIIHSVKGATFRILRTVEVDGYDDTPEAVELARALAARQPNAATLSRLLATKPTGDNFAGTARKTAKLSIATAAVEPFSDLQTVIQTLVADDKMIHRKPPITVTADSNRVAPEKRNVRVKSFLYAASREDDNDFHLIIGRDPARTPEMYMTAELSGLPPQNAASFTKLKAARDAFQAFFGAHLPGFTYDFYDPPIPVVIEGSLFFDMTHATGQRPGPQSLKSRMPTIWEIHPVSAIKLER